MPFSRNSELLHYQLLGVAETIMNNMCKLNYDHIYVEYKTLSRLAPVQSLSLYLFISLPPIFSPQSLRGVIIVNAIRLPFITEVCISSYRYTIYVYLLSTFYIFITIISSQFRIPFSIDNKP
ncbi:hypothetical protein QQP08_016002 [Theobroma cacao]|nr:hypothetical protein QQP08_016002 [Theobroma cacao]